MCDKWQDVVKMSKTKKPSCFKQIEFILLGTCLQISHHITWNTGTTSLHWAHWTRIRTSIHRAFRYLYIQRTNRKITDTSRLPHVSELSAYYRLLLCFWTNVYNNNNNSSTASIKRVTLHSFEFIRVLLYLHRFRAALFAISLLKPYVACASTKPIRLFIANQHYHRWLALI